MVKRKRKVVKLDSYKPLRSIREARTVTSKFHAYTKELEELKKTKKDATRIAELEKLLEEIGGRQRYQEASILCAGQNKSSSKWVFQNVTNLGMRPKKGEAPLKTLEVGAINSQLLSCPWLEVDAIDIKSRHPRIREIDFFKLPLEPGKYAVICNAMVLNCVPTPLDRGEMLARCVEFLREGGLLCIVLPIRCIDCISEDKYHHLLQDLGMRIVKTNVSPKLNFVAAVKESDGKICLCKYGGSKEDVLFDVNFAKENCPVHRHDCSNKRQKVGFGSSSSS